MLRLLYCCVQRPPKTFNYHRQFSSCFRSRTEAGFSDTIRIEPVSKADLAKGKGGSPADQTGSIPSVLTSFRRAGYSIHQDGK